MTGKLDWDGFWKTVLVPRGISDPDEIAHFHKKVWGEKMSINPEMRTLLEQIHPHYKLAILSNASWTDEELCAILTKHQLRHFFDLVVSSGSAGVAKPDHAIYRLTVKGLGLPAESCVFIDDFAGNTAAAAELGIHVFTYKTAVQLRQQLVKKGIKGVTN